jgi:hypothetical protein
MRPYSQKAQIIDPSASTGLGALIRIETAGNSTITTFFGREEALTARAIRNLAG